MKSTRFSIDPYYAFLMIFMSASIGIPLLMMWIGLKIGYPDDAVAHVSRFTLHASMYGSFVIFLVIFAIRGSSTHHAARTGQVLVLEKAFERLGRIDTRTLLKRTPLHFACKANNAAAVDFLLNKGANPEAKDVFGDTPKDLTTDEAVIRLFDEHEAQKSVRDQQAKRIDLDQPENDSITPRLTTEEFTQACASYLLRLGIVLGTTVLTLYLSWVLSNYISHTHRESCQILCGVFPLPAIVVMFSGIWWCERCAKKTGEIYCTQCKKQLIKTRHGVIATKRCPFCGHRHLSGQNQ